MAKDKEFEKEYYQVKLDRARIRRRERNRKRQLNKNLHGEICPHCHGVMTWCTICEMWSRYCCEEYGTCQCS